MTKTTKRMSTAATATTTDNPSADGLSPSTAFIRSLKRYGWHEFEVEEWDKNGGKKIKKVTKYMVVDFDKDLFIATCNPLSPTYNKELCNYDEMMVELFKVGDVWICRDLAEMAFGLIAARHGWCPTKEKRSLQCNRYGVLPDETASRNFTNGQLKVGCTLEIIFNSLAKESYIPDSQKDKPIKKRRQRDRWDLPVEVVNGQKKNTCHYHGGLCNPGRENKVASTSRAGGYIHKLPDKALYSLCNVLQITGKLTAANIKIVAGSAWPKKKGVTKQDVFNLRVKVMRSMPVFRKSNEDYKAFQEIVNSSDFLHGIDNDSLNDDEAYELAQSAWLEIVDTMNHNKDEAVFAYTDYLALIASRAPGFVYRHAEDTSGKVKKLQGVIWMTATMRRNFELFGGYICLDMMKRALNTLLWPYAAVTMFDEHHQICIACEGIVCGEKVDMYAFMARFLQDHAPGWPATDVHIVAGDGFFDQDMVTKTLGFVNAAYFTDQWHLLDSGLGKMFGESGYTKLNVYLDKMVQALSEDEFDGAYKAAEAVIRGQSTVDGPPSNVDGRLLETLNTFASKRKTYASYCFAQVPGNLERHGNAISESNHSSVITNLNNGDKKGNYTEDPIVQLRDLLKRQHDIVVKKNTVLFADQCNMNVERSFLSKQTQTKEVLDLRKSADVLNLPSYERYKSRSNRTNEYRVDENYVDPTSQQTCIAVFSMRYNNAPPRLFKNRSCRCGCNERIAYEDMCTHEILVKGGFDKDLFLPCHMARTVVESSLLGWQPNEPTSTTSTIDNIIGTDNAVYTTAHCINSIKEGIDASVDTALHTMDSTVGDPTPIASVDTSHHIGPPSLPVQITSKVDPWSRQHVNNTFSDCLAKYNKLNREKKLEICRLTMLLEEALGNGSNCTVVKSAGGGEFIEKPNHCLMLSQAKNRLKPYLPPLLLVYV